MTQNARGPTEVVYFGPDVSVVLPQHTALRICAALFLAGTAVRGECAVRVFDPHRPLHFWPRDGSRGSGRPPLLAQPPPVPGLWALHTARSRSSGRGSALPSLPRFPWSGAPNKSPEQCSGACGSLKLGSPSHPPQASAPRRKRRNPNALGAQGLRNSFLRCF